MQGIPSEVWRVTSDEKKDHLSRIVMVILADLKKGYGRG